MSAKSKRKFTTLEVNATTRWNPSRLMTIYLDVAGHIHKGKIAGAWQIGHAAALGDKQFLDTELPWERKRARES